MLSQSFWPGGASPREARPASGAPGWAGGPIPARLSPFIDIDNVWMGFSSARARFFLLLDWERNIYLFCAEKEICHLEAGDEDDDRNNDADNDGGGGGDDDVVEPLALAHTLGPDLPALRERHVGRGDLHLVRDKTLVEMVKMQNPKVLTRLELKMMGWLHLLKTDHTDDDALVVRNVLDLELALTRSQGWALLELWRSKESGSKQDQPECNTSNLDHLCLRVQKRGHLYMTRKPRMFVVSDSHLITIEFLSC